MSEPVQLAKSAREQLAAALNALQTSNVPDELVDAAEPVAQAMGVLHRIERTNGQNLEGRQDALDAVRTALSRVQLVDSPHPAVEKVMEAIAASLSKVHALVRYTPPAAPAAAPAPAPAPQPAPLARAVAVAPVAPAQPAPRQVGPNNTLPIANTTLPIMDAVAVSPAFARQERRETPPVLSAVQAQRPAPPQPSPAVEPVAPRPAAQPAARPAVASVASGSNVDVELGIHSTSNFYKGLGGNDVIEHGGIFVATYKVLKINSPVTLRVLLPGDYEFTASAVVQWTREGGTSEPGFGARFTQISADGRQLVYRYTRNREPMFYDDL
jgi:Tfp pilus assembly protein PilZ